MLGADMVIHGTLTLGVFFQFTAMLAYFLDPVKNILGLQSVIQSAAVSAKRLSGILELCEEKDEERGRSAIAEASQKNEKNAKIAKIERSDKINMMEKNEKENSGALTASFEFGGDISCLLYTSRCV